MRDNGSYMRMLLALLLLAFSRAGAAQTYTIATMAGGSAPPVRVAPATKVPIGGPNSIRCSRQPFIADSQATDFFCEHRIRKVSAEGIISTVAGPAQCQNSGNPAALTYTTSMAVDAAGNLFLAGLYDHRVRRLSPGGRLSVIAGNGSAGFSGDGGPATDAMLNYPIAVGTDEAGNVYVADAANNAVRVLRPVQNMEMAK